MAVLAIVALFLPASRAFAAPAAFDHVVLNVPDPAAAARWYAKNLDGKPAGAGSPAVAFGRTTIQFAKAAPGTAGSVGSVIDHLGFGYRDLDAAMQRFADSGVEIVSKIEQEGPIRYAFVKDPWGTLVEAVEDREIVGFHHIHLATPDPRATLAWYTDTLGGEVTRYAGILPGIRYGDVWLLVKKVKDPRAPSKGRSIDRVSWSVGDLKKATEDLKARKVQFEPAYFAPEKGVRITDPIGVRIELVEAPGG